MNYKEIMCKFCKKCTGEKIIKNVIKVNSQVNSDTIVLKCENYSQVEYEGNIREVLPF